MATIQTVSTIMLVYFLSQVPTKTITGNVVTVHQGDTFTVQSLPPNEKLYKVRLSNIDTPELQQPFGLKAKNFTINRILGKEVQVEYDMVDFYGRLIGSVALPKRGVLNEELIRAGLAWHYRVTPRLNTILERLQYDAWKKKIGIWVESSPIPPWEFRREKQLSPIPISEKQADYDLILNYGIVGNPKKRIYWWPDCKDYPEKLEKYVIFGYRELAESMGYQSSSGCD